MSASTRRAAHNAPEQSSRPISVINTHIHTFSENSYGISRPRESPNRRKQRFPKRIQLNFEHVELTSPTNFDEIYTAVTGTLEKSLREFRERPQLTFHLRLVRVPPPWRRSGSSWGRPGTGSTNVKVSNNKLKRDGDSLLNKCALASVTAFGAFCLMPPKPSAVLP